MPARDTTIRRQLMTIVLLTSAIVLTLTCSFFFIYEYVTFRRNAATSLETLGEIVATNSTAALAFDNPDDARQTLSALQAETQIVAAALYDRNGALFASYPDSLSVAALPKTIGQDGYLFEGSALAGFQPVVEEGSRRLGTLYLKSDMAAMYARFRLYGAMVALVIAASLVLAYLISRRLQRQISQPILALAETAQAISDRRDYSVRAASAGGQELKKLTDAFNHMLTEIQVQHGALKASEQRVRTVLNSALSAVVVIDSNGCILDWNLRAEAMFGWSRAEAVGRDLGDMLVPLRYREAHKRGMERYLATGETTILDQLLEMTAMRRDGEEFPVELFIGAIRTGDAVNFCGFITDITARRESQVRLQAQLGRLHLLQQITRAIAERQDLSSIFQVVIRSLEDNMPVDFGAVLLYTPGSDVLTVSHVGTRDAALYAGMELARDEQLPVDQSGLARCVKGALLYEPDIRHAHFAFTQRLARMHLCSLVAAPLLVESKVFGVLIVGRREELGFSSGDCEFLRHLSEHVALASHETQLHTALQRAYDDLRQSQNTALQQERLRALGEMASGIAHDINNAISPVSLYTEALLEAEPDLSPRARGYLTTIHRAIHDVANTVSRMREFSRPREAQSPFVPVAMNDLVNQVIDLTKARWSDLPQERGIVINLHTSLAENLPEMMGAPTEIRDALTNLVFNAVDAMPTGGELTIRTRETVDAESNACLAVEISDTGSGMTEETRQRCLEPFFTTKGERGTGLGLAMVYGMAQRHGATMEIETVLGKGTTMRIIMPVGAAVLVPSTTGVPDMAPSNALRILLVDDDPLVSEALELILVREGHVVTAANDGPAAIEIFADAIRTGAPFSIVITDLGMPHMDGRKVAAALKAESPETPVILLTGWGQRLLEENELPPFVDRVLSKPPKLQDLRSVLEELTAATAGQ